MSQTEVKFLGVVQVPLRQTRFVKGVGERLYKQQRTERLRKLFQKTSIDHKSCRHWIDGYIDSSEVPSLLSKLGLSHEQLEQTNQGGICPYVHDQLVYYTQGRHRIEAAKNIDPSSLWTVRLSYMSLTHVQASQTVKRRTEQYQHETPDSDGHIYSKLREYAGRDNEFFEWHERLSEAKQCLFQAINHRLAIAESLDRLIDLPGVIDFLQLGSYRKMFYYRLDEEVLAGFDFVYAEWSNFTCGSRVLQKAIDRDTVSMLEGRAPAASESDREWVRGAFENGKVFPGIAEPQRHEVERRVQMASCMIPSLRSLQSNMIYLSIAADIMWSHTLPREARIMARGNGLSLRATLQSYWVDSPPYVEVREGEFQPVLGPPSFDLAYNQLMLAALRQFPYLSDSKPKVEKWGKPVMSQDSKCVSLLQRRAQLLGFRSPTIAQDVAIPTSSFRTESWISSQEMEGFDEAEFLSRPDHRWGRPHARAFRIIQTSAFLPTIAGVSAQSGMSVLYVLQNLLRASFNSSSFEYDFSRPHVSLNESTEISRGPLTAATRCLHRDHILDGLHTIEEELGETNNCTNLGDSLDRQSEDLGTVRLHRSSRQVSAGRGDDQLLEHSSTARFYPTQEVPGSRSSGESAEPLAGQTSDDEDQLSFEPSTCTRSAWQSPSRTHQERSSLGIPMSSQPSFSSSLHPRSTIPTPPVCSSPRASLDLRRRRQRHWRAEKLRFPGLGPSRPATSTRQSSTASSSRAQSAARQIQQYGNILTIQSPVYKRSTAQQEGVDEDLWKLGLYRSPSLPRSIIPTPRSQGSLASIPTNLEAESLWSSQCQDEMQGMRALYPSQLAHIPPHVGSPLPLSTASRSTPPRSTCPTPRSCQSGQACIMDPSTPENMHKFLRTLPRGIGHCQPSGWQGFDDSEDDLESVNL